jgi:hypothetical protein
MYNWNVSSIFLNQSQRIFSGIDNTPTAHDRTEMQEYNDRSLSTIIISVQLWCNEYCVYLFTYFLSA